MRRYAVVGLIGTGALNNPYQPDADGSWVLLARRGAYCLIKKALADGTAANANAVADMNAEQSDVLATTLTTTQQTIIKNWLAERNFDVSNWDLWSITTRRRLLAFILRRFGFDEVTEWRQALHGYDVVGE